MLGAGVFASFGPAAAAAGSGLLIALAVVAVVAYCNATASARLAAIYPESGGTYVYGRQRLGPVWGFTAGWGFVVGKTASCAAMALTFGAYAWPSDPVPPAVAAVVVLTAVNYLGVAKTAGLTRILVAATLLALAVVVGAGLGGGAADPANLTGWTDGGVLGIGQAAALLFFSFAGYARIATLGEEVRDPQTTIPRAIPVALGIVLVVYAVIAVTALLTVGPAGLAAAAAPLAAVAGSGTLAFLAPVVQVGGAVASAGVLLSLMAGIGRTTLAMARDHELPVVLGVVHPRFRVRTAPRCCWARWWWWSCWPSTCGARSGSPASRCWFTTPSPTPPRSPSMSTRARTGAGCAWSLWSDCSAASCWPSPCPGRTGRRG